MNELEQRLDQHIEISKLDSYYNYEFKNLAIQQNYAVLVEDIDTDDVLDHLHSDMTLSQDNCERIKAQITTRDKNRLMLVMLDKIGEDGLKSLCKALSHREYLAQLLVK